MPDMPGDSAPVPADDLPPPEPTEPAPSEKPKRRRAKKALPKAKKRKRETNRRKKGKPRGKPRPLECGARGLDAELFAKVSKEILQDIRAGLAENVAAHAASVAPRTHRKWKTDGKAAAERRDAGEALSERDELLADYYDGCCHGAAVTEKRCVMVIQNVMDGSYEDERQARAALEASKMMLTLNRRFNDRWGTPKQVLELSGKNGGPIKGVLKFIDVTKLSDAELDKLAGAEPEAGDRLADPGEDRAGEAEADEGEGARTPEE